MKKIFIFLGIILIFFVLTKISFAVNQPIVLYTDLASGPTTGGENNKGVYLSVFGKNFGSSGLGTTVKVYINNIEVDNYRYLGSSKGRSDIQQISVQVGAIGNPTPGVALPIKVTVNGVESNTDKTFTPNPGRILFVSLLGDDSLAVADNITRPYRYIQSSNWSAQNRSGALGAAIPGDVIVMRSGTWSDQGMLDGSRYFLKFRYAGGSAPTGALGSGPITIMGYPGEDVYVYTPSTFGGAISGVNRMNYPTDSDWITIADLRVRSDTWDGPINMQVMADHWRIVNNDLSDQTTGTAKAGGVAGNGAYPVILGNKIHDIAGNTLENHGIYFDGGTNQANPLIEIAYNDIGNIPGGSCFQIYNVGTNGPNVSGITVPVSNLYFHHNIMKNCGKYGVNIADGSGNNIRVYNNSVDNTVNDGVRINATCRYNNPGEGCNALMGLKIYHNTFYNLVTGTSNYNAISNTWDNSTSNQIDIRNNIVIPHNSLKPYVGGPFGSGTFTRNLWYGSGGSPAGDTSPINADPLFVSSNDFHLQSTSPAIDNSPASLSFVISNDLDILSRPQGASSDIGAYEYVSTTLDTTPPSAPTGLSIQ